MSDRGCVDKRTTFNHDNSIYVFSTSIPTTVYTDIMILIFIQLHEFTGDDGIVRIIYMVNFLKLEENEECFIFTGIQQIDMNMKVNSYMCLFVIINY